MRSRTVQPLLEMMGVDGDGLECGEPEAFCSQFGGELVVNGDLYVMLPDYVNLCGEAGVCCDATIQAGDFMTYGEKLQEVTYDIPTDPGYCVTSLLSQVKF
jgi:hypothetical protein